MNKNNHKIQNFENFQKTVLYVKQRPPQLKISNQYLDFWPQKLNFFLQHDGQWWRHAIKRDFFLGGGGF